MYCCVFCGPVFFSSVALCQSAACTLGQLCGPWDARSTNRFKTGHDFHTRTLRSTACTDSTTQLHKKSIHLDHTEYSREVWRLCHILRRRRRLRSRRHIRRRREEGRPSCGRPLMHRPSSSSTSARFHLCRMAHLHRRFWMEGAGGGSSWGRRRLLQMRMMRIMMHGSSSAQRGGHLPWY